MTSSGSMKHGIRLRVFKNTGSRLWTTTIYSMWVFFRQKFPRKFSPFKQLVSKFSPKVPEYSLIFLSFCLFIHIFPPKVKFEIQTWQGMFALLRNCLETDPNYTYYQTLWPLLVFTNEKFMDKILNSGLRHMIVPKIEDEKLDQRWCRGILFSLFFLFFPSFFSYISIKNREKKYK